MSKKSNAKETNATSGDAIPDDAIEALARMLYPAMVAYFESEIGKREFAEWQAQRAKEGGQQPALSVVLVFLTIFSILPFCTFLTILSFSSRPPKGWAY